MIYDTSIMQRYLRHSRGCPEKEEIAVAYLVTGGTGLIGARIVRDLAREKENVVAFDLNLDLELMEHVLTDEERKYVTYVSGNILDYDLLVSACKENHVDTIVHTASMLGNADKPFLSVEVNTGGMMRVLEAARTLGLKKVVYSSTNSVFPVAETGLIANDARLDPDGLYGCTKAFNELVAEMYYRNYGIDITGIRISSMVFGAFQKRGVSGSMAAEAIYKPAEGLPGHVPHNDAVAWVHVDEVSRAHLLACKLQRKPGMAGVYNLNGTVLDFATLITYVKSLIPDAQITMGDQDSGLKNWNMDMSVTERELGYKPQLSIWDAIKDTINEIRKQSGLSSV